MKIKVGRKWEDAGPAHVQSTLLSIVLPSRHTHGAVDCGDEAADGGFVFSEPGKRPFQAGGCNRSDIGTHEIRS